MRHHWADDTELVRVSLDVDDRRCRHRGCKMHVCDHRRHQIETLEGQRNIICRLVKCSMFVGPGSGGHFTALQDLELGLLKTPFGMDAMTSGRELIFMERQLSFALAPFRQIMIGARGTSDEKTVSWGGAVYRMPTDSFGVYEGGSGGIAVAGRVSSALFYEDEGATVLHLGSGYSVGTPGDGAVRYRIQPGFFTRDPGTDAGDPGTVPVFLDTGDIAASAFHLFNLEAGMNLGDVHVVSEMRWSNVNQDTGPNLTFPSFYVQASYVLTGENHRYSRERGVFQRVIPKRPFERGKGAGFGALEAAIGYSMLDLNQQNIAGGRGEVLALGLNWA